MHVPRSQWWGEASCLVQQLFLCQLWLGVCATPVDVANSDVCIQRALLVHMSKTPIRQAGFMLTTPR
eukprot:7903135-Pyramimonas_sp.AAC.1